MKLLEKAERIRIYIGEDEKYNGKNLAETIVRKAHDLKLAGATVYRGLMGYGANSRIRTSSILRLSEGLPVIVEIVDHPDRLEPFLAELTAMVEKGMVTREPIDVVLYRHSE